MFKTTEYSYYSSYLLSTDTMQLKAIFSKIILCDCQTGVNCNALYSAGFDWQMPREVSCLF